MNKDSIVKYGLQNDHIDINKSYEYFDESTSTTIIHLYFTIDKNLLCPCCNCNDYRISGSKKNLIKSSSVAEPNLNIYLHRRTFKCNVCGSIFKEDNPYSYKSHSLSLNKIICILNEIRKPTKTFKDIAEQFQVSPTTVLNVFDKYVSVPRHELPEIISFDEVYTRKLVKNNYCFIIYSPIEKKIIDLVESRRMNNLISYFSKIPVKELKKVKYVSIDLYDTYRRLAKDIFYDPIICADPFHVIKNISVAFNNIRIQIMKKYSQYKGENSHRYWLLKKFWKLILKDPSKLTYDKFHIRKFDMWLSQIEIVFEILKTDPILSKAYDLINEYKMFNKTYTYEECADKLDYFIKLFLSFPSEYYIKIGHMLKNWRPEIINSFICIDGKRITNGFIERKNKDIKTIIRLGNGYRNFPRFRNRVLFSLNDNESILSNPKNKTNKYRKKKRK